MLRLRNPHSALAALETRPSDVTEIVAPSGSFSDAWEKVARLARDRGVRVTSSRDQDRRGNRDRRPDEGGRTSAAEAVVREREGVPAELLFKDARERAGGKGLWLALDCLQDPHNLGAIFRASAFFGVQGILITEERSAPLSAAAYDVASGGMEHVPFTLQTNLQRGFEIAKDAGLWILGTSEHAKDDLLKVERDRPWLLVLGNEEKGLRRLTEESCDTLAAIRPRGGAKVTSLNVSVAAGIAIAHLAG
jgi:23S rRNA (guanosine2251-2'-O)-methyltransferase